MLQITHPQLSQVTGQQHRASFSTDSWSLVRAHVDVISTSLQQVSFIVGKAYFIAKAGKALTCSTAQAASLFQRLRDEWYEQRGSTSSITQMAMCPAYQRIIGMGPDAIPFILRQLQSEGDQPDMWFWALRVLTNADPVSENERGDFVAMAASWLSWARGRYAW